MNSKWQRAGQQVKPGLEPLLSRLANRVTRGMK